MKETIILVAVLLLFNIIIHFYINLRNKKNSKNIDQPRKVQFNAEFFGLAFIPTSILIIIVADEFYKFIALFVYFIIIVFIADKVYKKHLNQEMKTNLK